MTRSSRDDMAQPLPREWLPEALPPEGDRAWDDSVARVMDATAPELHALRSRRSTGGHAEWSGLALWWKPAAALAAASIALLLLADPTADPDPSPSSLALEVIASDGDAATLWEMLGVHADPVLALIAIREPQTTITPAAQSPSRDEENR